jgi:hypothetical protein
VPAPLPEPTLILEHTDQARFFPLLLPLVVGLADQKTQLLVDLVEVEGVVVAQAQVVQGTHQALHQAKEITVAQEAQMVSLTV